MGLKQLQSESKKVFRVELHFTNAQNALIEKAVKIKGKENRKQFLQDLALWTADKIVNGGASVVKPKAKPKKAVTNKK